jgi:hypothetical protein
MRSREAWLRRRSPIRSSRMRDIRGHSFATSERAATPVSRRAAPRRTRRPRMADADHAGPDRAPRVLGYGQWRAAFAKVGRALASCAKGFCDIALARQWGAMLSRAHAPQAKGPLGITGRALGPAGTSAVGDAWSILLHVATSLVQSASAASDMRVSAQRSRIFRFRAKKASVVIHKACAKEDGDGQPAVISTPGRCTGSSASYVRARRGGKLGRQPNRSHHR